MRKYAIMMAIRMVCFALMVLVTPYGWYTFVFGAGAAVLPYLAVVVANVGASRGADAAQSPERELTSGAPETPAATTPPVIQVRESPAPKPPRTRDTEQ